MCFQCKSKWHKGLCENHYTRIDDFGNLEIEKMAKKKEKDAIKTARCPICNWGRKRKVTNKLTKGRQENKVRSNQMECKNCGYEFCFACNSSADDKE